MSTQNSRKRNTKTIKETETVKRHKNYQDDESENLNKIDKMTVEQFEQRKNKHEQQLQRKLLSSLNNCLIPDLISIVNTISLMNLFHDSSFPLIMKG